MITRILRCRHILVPSLPRHIRTLSTTPTKMVTRIPNDIFQFSTVSALMSGLCSSGPSASQLTGYGSHGLGTCSELNGEVLFLDSIAWHMTTTTKSSTSPRSDQEALNDEAKQSDPVIKRADPDAQLPFVQVTLFQPEFSVPVSTIRGELTKTSLLETISGRASGMSGGKNSFIPFRITGTFPSLTLRIGGPKKSRDETLGGVTARAPQWRLAGVKGTIFGFMSPEWSNGISVAGFHGHFIEDIASGSRSDDEKTRRGGHVLDFKVDAEEQGKLEWGVTGRYHLGMPRGKEWEGLDLGVDAAGIHEAEG